MSNSDESKCPSLPVVFFPENELLAPRDLRKFGWRLAKGMEYRLYSLAEIPELVKEGKILPIKKRPVSEEYVWQPGDDIPAQLAILGTAKRSKYLRAMLKRCTITLSWDEAGNRPKIAISQIATKDETNHP